MQDRLHAQFTHRPSTLRLSCVNPNLQNIEKGSRFRTIFVAAPGCVLLEADFSAIEAVLTGWCVGDKNFIRLAKLGIHDYHGAAVFGRYHDLSLPDVELGKILAQEKEILGVQRDKSKRTIYGCLTGDHEVLTPEGWVRLDELVAGVSVAQWDHGKLSFNVPATITKRYWEGDMVTLEGCAISAVMTPWHRVGIISNGNLITRNADSLLNDDRIPTGGELAGLLEDPINSKLAIAIQADGHVMKTQTKFCLKKSRKKKRLEALLSSKNYTRIEYPNYPGRTYYTIQNTQLEDSLKYLEGSTKDFVLERFLDLSLDNRLEAVDEATHWDGMRAGKQGWYVSTNRHNAEVMQTLAHVSGIQALFRNAPNRGTRLPLYKVSFNKRKLARVGSLKTWETKPWRGEVFCVSVPSSYFLIRRHGKISVTGNTLYGMSAAGLHKTYSELFPTVKLAAENQELLHRLLPKLREWQNATRVEASKKNYLGGSNHPFHYKHWFWDVFSYDKTGAMKLGSDSKRVVAYYPQSIAAGIIKESALRLVEQGPYYIGDWFFGKTPIRALIHDSIVLEIPKNLLDRALEKIVGAMTMPNPQLPCPAEWGIGTHLSIGVAVKVGEDWKNMSKIGLPEIGTASETAVEIEEEGQ